MIRRLLGWLGYTAAGPAVKQGTPPDLVCVHGVDSLEECEPCTTAAIDAAIMQARLDGDTDAVHRLLDARIVVRARHAIPRPSTPGGQP